MSTSTSSGASRPGAGSSASQTRPPPGRVTIARIRPIVPHAASATLASGAIGLEYQPLGHSGLIVSVVGLGTNNFGGRLDLERTRAVVDRAIERGITLFDTAESYGGGQSEAFIGESLGNRRHDVILATKFGWNATLGRNSRRYLKEAVERSLRRLKTDYID
ncbi:MAG: aldo/keto reductase, partial [Chloroflexi bacterium]|nr:aldo/keto reductase [Chloroflexota bacterium]